MKLLELARAQKILDQLLELTTDAQTIKARQLIIRGLLEEMYKELTRDAQVSANGLFARMQYYHDLVNIPAELSKQANLLRIYGNKVAHDGEIEPSMANFLTACHVMHDLLAWYQEELELDALASFLTEHNATLFADRPQAKRHDLTCVVHSWRLTKTDERVTGIEIQALDENGVQVYIKLRDRPENGEGSQWSLLGRCMWQWATLNCINVSESSGAPNQYIDNHSTMMVLEPDYLMDVTSIAECISQNEMHPQLAILSRLISEGASQSMVQGIAVNNIFDDLMEDPQADYDELFRRSMDRAPIPMVALGIDAAKEIHTCIKNEHFPRLKAMAQLASKDEMMLEPSYISPRYGLQGRLDLLYKRGDKYCILELKSGSAPKFQPWSQHQAQVVGYNMLIRNSYPKGKLGTSSILYSRLPQKSLLHVVNTKKEERTLIMCRNRILGLWKQLAEDPAIFFAWLKTYDGSGLPQFSWAKLNKVQTLLGSLSPMEYEWYLEQIRLAVRETWYAKIGSLGSIGESSYGYNALWQLSREEKERRYRIIQSMKLQSATTNVLRFSRPDKTLISNFREGDVVIAYREDLPVWGQEIIRAELIRLEDDHLELRARGVLNINLETMGSHTWALEHDLLETMLFGPLASITGFLTATPQKRHKLMGILEPEFDTVAHTSTDDIDAIIAQIDSAKDYCVIQGPPGTGKTSGLLTRYIKKLYHETKQTILVLSFTNRAVDEICLNLHKHDIPFIRTGRSQNIEEQLLENLIRGKRFFDIDNILRSNRVWVATVQSCNSWIQDLMSLKEEIGTLIIDEASQIIEPAILGILAKAQRCILVGDQNQLPPIISQDKADYSFTSNQLNDLCYSSYNRSMMERLYLKCKMQDWHQGHYMLQKHYRMHEEIASLINHYYQDSLHSALPRQNEPLSLPEASCQLDGRIIWIDTPKGSTAFYDDHHCQLILKLIKTFEALGELQDHNADLGIVAPFRAMIQALRNTLGKKYENITIDTVERFQGSERKVIILTLPLRESGELRNLEAVSDDGSVDRKLNVALSRAMDRIIILGNAALCSASPHYAFLIDKIHSAHKMIPSNHFIDDGR